MSDTSGITPLRRLLFTGYNPTAQLACTVESITVIDLFCNDVGVYTDTGLIFCNNLTYASNLVDSHVCIPSSNLPLVNYNFASLETELTYLPLGGNLPFNSNVPVVVIDDLVSIPFGGNLPLASNLFTSLLDERSDVVLGNLPLTGNDFTSKTDDVAGVALGDLPLTSNDFTSKTDDIASVALGNLPLTGNDFVSTDFDQVSVPFGGNLELIPKRLIATLDEILICINTGATIDIVRDDTPVQIISDPSNKVVIVKDEPVLVLQDTDNILIIQEPATFIKETRYVISKTIYDGEDEQELMFSKRIDFITDNLLYRGEAEPGISTADPYWRIRRITISDIDDDIIEIWASGDDNFDKVWDSRIGYSYL
jgi:hypothetical protein